MTKPDYTHTIVPTELHERLKVIAQLNNASISQLIARLVNINLNINVSINTAQLDGMDLSHLQALNQKSSLNQLATQKGKEWKP